MLTAILISSIIGFGLGFGFHDAILVQYFKIKDKIKAKL